MLVILMVIRPLVKRAIEINMAQNGILPGDMNEPYGLLASPSGMTVLGGSQPQMVAGPDGKMVAVPSGQVGVDGLPGDVVGEGFSLLDGIQGRQKPSSIKQINEIISNSPEEALAALRSWMYGEATA